MKKIFVLIFLIILLLASFYAFNFLNRSAKEMSQAEKEAQIAKILGRKPNLGETVEREDQIYKGKYISFVYPGNSNEEKQLLNGTPLPYDGLERFIFRTTDDPKVRVYVEVINTPSNVSSLSDYPSVKLRQLGSYIQKEEEIDGIKGLSFTIQGQNSFEESVFFMKNGKIYSFSFQGAGERNVSEVYKTVITSARLF